MKIPDITLDYTYMVWDIIDEYQNAKRFRSDLKTPALSLFLSKMEDECGMISIKAESCSKIANDISNLKKFNIARTPCLNRVKHQMSQWAQIVSLININQERRKYA